MFIASNPKQYKNCHSHVLDHNTDYSPLDIWHDSQRKTRETQFSTSLCKIVIIKTISCNKSFAKLSQNNYTKRKQLPTLTESFNKLTLLEVANCKTTFIFFCVVPTYRILVAFNFARFNFFARSFCFLRL